MELFLLGLYISPYHWTVNRIMQLLWAQARLQSSGSGSYALGRQWRSEGQTRSSSLAVVAALGPSQQSPDLNLAAVGLRTAGSAAGGLEGPDPILWTAFPVTYFTEVQSGSGVAQLLHWRGLFVDSRSCEGQGNLSVTDIAWASLNGISRWGCKTLTVHSKNVSFCCRQKWDCGLGLRTDVGMEMPPRGKLIALDQDKWYSFRFTTVLV